MNFKELVRNKDGLGASCLARCGSCNEIVFGQTPKVLTKNGCDTS